MWFYIKVPLSGLLCGIYNEAPSSGILRGIYNEAPSSGLLGGIYNEDPSSELQPSADRNRPVDHSSLNLQQREKEEG